MTLSSNIFITSGILQRPRSTCEKVKQNIQCGIVRSKSHKRKSDQHDLVLPQHPLQQQQQQLQQQHSVQSHISSSSDVQLQPQQTQPVFQETFAEASTLEQSETGDEPNGES